MPLCREVSGEASVGWVSNAKFARQAIDSERYDVIIWATHGPDALSMGFVEEVRTALPQAGMIVLSHEDTPVFGNSLHLIGPDPHTIEFGSVALLLRQFLPRKA